MSTRPETDGRDRSLLALGLASAAGWALLLAPALVHFRALLEHDYKFLSSWVQGLPRLTEASARVDGLVFSVLVAGLLACWVLALRVAARGAAEAPTRRLVLLFALVFFALNLAQVPFTSADPFYYRGVGLVVADGGNPYVDPVERDIPFFEEPVRATHHAPLWGPPMLWLLGAATALGGASIVAGIFALKLAVAAFHLLNLWLVGRVVREIAPERETFALVLYGWSPLMVFEHVGIGHNDPPMLTGLILSVWCVHRRRYVLACLAVAAGTAFKVPAVLAALPLAAVMLRAPDERGVPRLLAGGGLSLLLLALLYAPYWAGAETFSGLAHFRDAYFGSLPQGVRLLLGLPVLPTAEGDPALFARGFEAFWLVVFAAGCAWVVRDLWQRGSRVDATDYAEAVVMVFLLYLVTEQRYYWSWYASWALALAALGRPERFAVRAAVVLAVGSLLGSAAYRFGPPLASFTVPVQSAAIALSFGPLLVLALVTLVRSRAQASR